MACGSSIRSSVRTSPAQPGFSVSARITAAFALKHGRNSVLGGDEGDGDAT
jgi:hypothetical protein